MAEPALPSAAVLVVHGPAGQSLTALRRLEALVDHPGRIVVVPGTAPGLVAAERAAERGVTAVLDHGPAALESAIAGLEGPTLVIHDDVEITPTTAANMVAAHRATGHVAVATDRSRLGRREITEANLVCAVGAPGRLAPLAARAAFGPGLAVTGPFIEAADAPMIHTGDCQRRLVDERHLDRPVLVAAMIVRDEADHIRECLASLDGIVDRVEIADTGSVDDTVEIAREAGANVVEIGWRNDFAWARNQILERCTDASYMLWIDADERLVCQDRHHLRRLLGTYHRLYPAYSLAINNIDGSGFETHSFVAKRIADPSLIRFEGALHEQPRRLDGRELLEVCLGTVSLDHLGYSASVVDERDKLARNLDIARRSFESEPTEEHAVHFARSLKATSTDPHETLDEIEPLIDLVEEAAAPVRALMLALRAELLLAAGRLDEAAEVARDALELVPADAVAGAVLAEALLQRGAPDEALAAAAEFGGRQSPAPLVTDHVAAQTRAHALFDAALQVGDVDAAVARLSELPPAVDPWRSFDQALDTDGFSALASAAGSVSDGRFLSTLVRRADLTADGLAAAETAFMAAGGEIADPELMDAARRELDLVAQAPHLRNDYVASGSIEDAIGYSSALATGHMDLTLELESAPNAPEPVAVALAVAAEANRRRGRASSAVLDAADALRLWPGAIRAAIVAAEAARDAGDPRGALDVVHAARRAQGFSDLQRGHRHELTTVAARAHLDLGDAVSAVGESVEIVDERGEIDYWDLLLDAAGDDRELITLVLGLALLGDGEAFLDAAARTLRPDRTAEICGAYLEVGGDNPNAVSTGILAAVLTGGNDLAVSIAGYARLLPDDVRERLRVHVADAGAAEVADGLAAQPVG